MLKSSNSKLELRIQGIAASQIVEYKGIPRLQYRQLLVDFEAVLETTALGVVITEELEGFGEFRVTVQYPLQKTDLDVKITHLFARKLFCSITALARHTTHGIVLNGVPGVKVGEASPAFFSFPKVTMASCQRSIEFPGHSRQLGANVNGCTSVG
jgi:hypothetical protein